MRFTAFIDRLDDWINPIVVKELRQAVRSRAVVGILLVFLGLQLFIVGANLLLGSTHGLTAGAINWTAGRDVFQYLQILLLITLMLLVPAYACVRLAGERSDNNVDLLFISTLKPHSIIAGKFFAAVMLAVLVLSACAPFMTFTYLLRGIDIPTILTMLGLDLLCMTGGTMLALFLAALPGGRVVKIVACLAGFIFLLILCLYLAAGTVMMVREGVISIDSSTFWVIAGTITAVVLGWVGLLFFYSVVMISPHSSNRILPVRVYVLTVWLLTAVALVVLSRWYSAFEFYRGLILCTTLFVMVLSLQFLISLCERDHWGLRVARTIPQRWWLRVPAFFLYTGSAGGVLLSVIMLGLTLLAGAWWLLENEGHPGHETVQAWLGTFLIAILYTYCYGLSGVLVRVYLLSGQIRQGFTWVIVMLLVGLGSSIPAMVALIIFPDQVRSGNEGYWWKLPSPFLAIGEASPSYPGARIDNDFVKGCFWFLAVWAFLVSLACLPWFVGQVVRFRPTRRTEVQLAESEPDGEPIAVSPAVNGASPMKSEAADRSTSIQAEPLVDVQQTQVRS